VAALAHSLSAFENLRVLEIRENPGVGGCFLVLCSPLFLFFSKIDADLFLAVHFSVLAQSLQHCSNLKVAFLSVASLSSGS
jgi:hypothetical protein